MPNLWIQISSFLLSHAQRIISSLFFDNVHLICPVVAPRHCQRLPVVGQRLKTFNLRSPTCIQNQSVSPHLECHSEFKHHHKHRRPCYCKSQQVSSLTCSSSSGDQSLRRLSTLNPFDASISSTVVPPASFVQSLYHPMWSAIKLQKNRNEESESINQSIDRTDRPTNGRCRD